ncbi:unnamed protein product [Fusarium graminearum]|uniref:Uncharacterized protein n=1 Tax=Gibberella zeae TaxID=5518 RepID=A0A4U9F608_GIBZA|nr:unnamed protein product [Fusarium graminearum]CAG1960719.1 unnamed protein product [Fusarium graminearum]CAG1975416.1 unnamed protein product [Fusarium graminearum]VTO88982.1 unnamed protein product [Fusarium graminearum]
MKDPSEGLVVKRAGEAGGRPTKQKLDADGTTAEVVVYYATCARYSMLCSVSKQDQAELR